MCVRPGGGGAAARGGGEGRRERPRRGWEGGERPVRVSKALFKMYENCNLICLDAEFVTGYETSVSV